MLKVWRLGWKTSGFQIVKILKICWTSGLDVMSGRALLTTLLYAPPEFTDFPTALHGAFCSSAHADDSIREIAF